MPRPKPRAASPDRHPAFAPRSLGYQRTRVNTRTPSFLIGCEGARTEPLYFKAFPLARGRVDVVGHGKNTHSLVRAVVQRRDEAAVEGLRYNEVWAVFDHDSFKKEQIDAAFQLARNEQINLGFTNEAFELWYLLHFIDCDAALSRTQYATKLARHLGRPYKKNDPAMFSTLLPRRDDALRNARRLARINRDRENPSTTIHLLVERLMLLEQEP